MKKLPSVLLLVVTVWSALAGRTAVAQDRKEIATREVQLTTGETIEYGFVEPENFDPEKEYPVLLALPPGAQNKQMVKASFDLYWNQGGENGWVVICPAAPNGKFFNKGSELLMPEFLEKIRERYKPAGGKFHLTGVSNGGTSAFRIAGLYPDKFHSLMAMPGFPLTNSDKENLARLKGMPVALYVGEEDTRWIEPMEATAKALKKQGNEVTWEVVANQGHVIRIWTDGKKLFNLLNKWNDKAAEVAKSAEQQSPD